VPSPARTTETPVNAYPDLSAVIPVHNASNHLGDLVNRFLGIDDLDVEILLIDDGSTDGSDQLIDTLAGDDRISAVHHRRNLGAGVARNAGFALASGRYTIFFDADDTLHPGPLRRIVDRLDHTGADVVMMPYRYRRSSVVPADSMNQNDVTVWEEYLGGTNARLVRLPETPMLLELTNYPWNKIIRTSTYQSNGLRFGSTPVHNDILGHWYTLLFADRILLTNEILCTHVVERGANNLTNLNQRSRLTLFDALDETYSLLEAHPHLRSRYASNYWSLALRVSDWAASQLDPATRAEFNARLQAHLLRIRLDDFMRIRLTAAPVLADRLVNKVIA
jgi:glycosyltransferase involved in cell wall biosynthesis